MRHAYTSGMVSPFSSLEWRSHYFENRFIYDQWRQMHIAVMAAGAVGGYWLAGKVVQLGRSLSVPAPANEAVYAAVKLHRFGRGLG